MKREITFPTNVDLYKPFAKVKDGFGYEGILLCDKKTSEIQCHLCGKWFHWLNVHIRSAHKMKAEEYKLKFGLRLGTALCSEVVREQMVRRAMLYPWERLQRSGERLKRIRTKGKRGRFASMEQKNENGTCSLQLIDRMVKLSKNLGRQPYYSEMISERGTNMKNTIVDTFGSVQKMREILSRQGFTYVHPNTQRSKKQIPEEVLLKSIRDFTRDYGRRPSSSDMARGILYGMNTYKRRFGSWSHAKELAFT